MQVVSDHFESRRKSTACVEDAELYCCRSKVVRVRIATYRIIVLKEQSCHCYFQVLRSDRSHFRIVL